MASRYEFRHFKGTWGLWTALTAEAAPINSSSELLPIIAINKNVWVQLRVPRISYEKFDYLVKGFSLVLDQIQAHKKMNGPVLIVILNIELAPSDFQLEAIACAAVGWAANEFGFEPPIIPITFNKDNNRYIVDLSCGCP
jgi:hypothetical protein